MQWDELENGLAWFASAPAAWISSGRKNFGAAAEWIWEVIQGDFAEQQSTAQVVTGTVISMIPFVDQICDVRDVVANCKKINEDTADRWAWVGLVLTLIGLFPVLGSLAKGCCKILFAYGRKSVLRASKAALDTDFWKASKPFVETGILKLNQHLQTPAVRAALKTARIANPYKWIASKVREVAAGLNVSALSRAFDTVLEALRYFVKLIKQWGGTGIGSRAVQLLESVQAVRALMNTRVDSFIGPVVGWLNKLARRLDIEADMLYRANTNAVNPHIYRGVSNDAEEVVKFDTAKPAWVDSGARMLHPPMRRAPSSPGWPDISDTSPHPALKGKYDTFSSAVPVLIPEGEVIYRVVDPASSDNSICWMRKSEFEKLKSKDDWRRYFAVKGNWNANGEVVTYTVPKGGLPAWEGPAASQEYKSGAITKYTLEGGAAQLVIDPAKLEKELMGSRQKTNWGYTDFCSTGVSMVGVPTLKNNWWEKK